MAEGFAGPLANHSGSYSPTGYVVGVLDGPQEAEQAARALRECGCAADPVRVFAADEVLAVGHRFRQERTLAQRVEGFFACDEGEAQQQYLEAAQRGHAFVTVHAPDPAEARRVAAVFTQHGGHALRHYCPSVMTDLAPPRGGEVGPGAGRVRPPAPTRTPRVGARGGQHGVDCDGSDARSRPRLPAPRRGRGRGPGE
jgi:hypothetical protein